MLGPGSHCVIGFKTGEYASASQERHHVIAVGVTALGASMLALHAHVAWFRIVKALQAGSRFGKQADLNMNESHFF